MIFLISDESGDDGIFSNPKADPKGRFFTSIMLGFLKEQGVLDFSNAAHSSAKKNLHRGNLKKWSDMYSDDKSNADTLSRFLEDTISGYRAENPRRLLLGTFTVIDKLYAQPINKGNGNFQKIDKIKVYEGAIKRIVPCLKQVHARKGEYRQGKSPEIHWYIDNNSGIFREKIQTELGNLIRDIGASPKVYFVPKDSQATNLPSFYNRAVRVADIFCGIKTKAFCEHISCCNSSLTDSHECSNSLRRPWDILSSLIHGFNIEYHGKNIWKWEGYFFVPQGKRELHSNLIPAGTDFGMSSYRTKKLQEMFETLSPE